MTRLSTKILMVSAAVLALSACSGTEKGPGPIGTKNDIVVNNHGLPQAPKTAAASDPSAAENLEPNPAPAVAAAEPVPAPDEQSSAPSSASLLTEDDTTISPLSTAEKSAKAGATETEPLPDTSPAMEAAVQQVQDAKAPVSSTAATPMTDVTTASTAPITQTTQADNSTPPPAGDAASASAEPAATPVPQTAPSIEPPVAAASASTTMAAAQPMPQPVMEPAPAAAPPSAIPPIAPPGTSDIPEEAAAAMPAPTSAPMPSPAQSSVYPAEDFAATSAAAAVAPSAASSTPAAATVPMNFYDPSIIKAAQTALKTKNDYLGKDDGVITTEFLNALSEYQAKNKLPQGGLNELTLRSLGVIE